jgi:hypothetical protein
MGFHSEPRRAKPPERWLGTTKRYVRFSASRAAAPWVLSLMAARDSRSGRPVLWNLSARTEFSLQPRLSAPSAVAGLGRLRPPGPRRPSFCRSEAGSQMRSRQRSFSIARVARASALVAAIGSNIENDLGVVVSEAIVSTSAQPFRSPPAWRSRLRPTADAITSVLAKSQKRLSPPWLARSPLQNPTRSQCFAPI